MTSEELKSKLDSHKLWLSGDESGCRADLSRANLIGADLSRANLSGANLRGADLIGANLRGANLIDANLIDANLIDANLRGADLIGADLSRANLSRANLSGANLRGAKNVILQFIASRHQVNVIDNMVRIGCQNHDLQWWLENYQEVGQSERYTEKEIAEYGMILDHIKRVLELRMESKSEVAPPSVTGDEG